MSSRLEWVRSIATIGLLLLSFWLGHLYFL
ncbi:hypothetical protein Pan216_27340 [Planctomycetes bacterium Pan216]|uniref:Uncharacterized protein n=1 Tax=Kolteria novifilia TaxID=2527975 RepID=A0A518B4F0_9BACT|nr:hypothetical protein Pan216_27340 [Planctomycetes bacterium Pan216]